MDDESGTRVRRRPAAAGRWGWRHSIAGTAPSGYPQRDPRDPAPPPTSGRPRRVAGRATPGGPSAGGRCAASSAAAAFKAPGTRRLRSARRCRGPRERPRACAGGCARSRSRAPAPPRAPRRVPSAPAARHAYPHAGRCRTCACAAGDNRRLGPRPQDLVDHRHLLGGRLWSMSWPLAATVSLQPMRAMSSATAMATSGSTTCQPVNQTTRSPTPTPADV